MIIIGLGSGRTGTASQAKLIGSQKDAICFHELNPSCAVAEGNPQPVLNTINEFQRIIDGGDRRLLSVDHSRERSVKTYQQLLAMERNPRIMGDIAYYYLNYVDDILAVNPSVKFVCIKRDREQTVESWMRKSRIPRWRSLVIADRLKSWITRTPYHDSWNFWQEHDGSRWAPNPVWDSTFPKFKADSKREAIGKYWDWYYETAEQTQARHPDSFRIFDISKLSNSEGQKEILAFCGIPEEEMRLFDNVHEHKSRG
ncbi:MAG TPA: hypothetical protein ENK53_07530 [Thiotrichales bacterium]|nr:hypothetical protein [Thiotrichales bacterium]